MKFIYIYTPRGTIYFFVKLYAKHFDGVVAKALHSTFISTRSHDDENLSETLGKIWSDRNTASQVKCTHKKEIVGFRTLRDRFQFGFHIIWSEGTNVLTRIRFESSIKLSSAFRFLRCDMTGTFLINSHWLTRLVAYWKPVLKCVIRHIAREMSKYIALSMLSGTLGLHRSRSTIFSVLSDLAAPFISACSKFHPAFVQFVHILPIGIEIVRVWSISLPSYRKQISIAKNRKPSGDPVFSSALRNL